MKNWTSVIKGRSNTSAVVGDKILGWDARTFKLLKEIHFLSCFLNKTINVIVPCQRVVNGKAEKLDVQVIIDNLVLFY